jgi:hypothetical protein
MTESKYHAPSTYYHHHHHRVTSLPSFILHPYIHRILVNVAVSVDFDIIASKCPPAPVDPLSSSYHTHSSVHARHAVS